MKQLISIVIPFYNEEKNISKLFSEIDKLIFIEKKYQFEIITVEHGSQDSTFEKLKKIRNLSRNKIKIIQLSKNFGNADSGIVAGLNYAKGDAVVIMMADLQEPPLLVSEFLRKWEKGYEVVYGIVKSRPNISFTRKILTAIFYKTMNVMTGNIFPENVSDFRLIDKGVCEVINDMPERNKYLRGLIAWSGFKSIGIKFDRLPRYRGKSKANLLTVIKVASNGIFSFSYIPLRLVTILGVALSVFSFLMIIIQIMLFLRFGRGAPGISTLVVLISFLFGMLFLILGIIGEYLSRIYDEVKQRPSYIVKKTIGVSKD